MKAGGKKRGREGGVGEGGGGGEGGRGEKGKKGGNVCVGGDDGSVIC